MKTLFAPLLLLFCSHLTHANEPAAMPAKAAEPAQIAVAPDAAPASPSQPYKMTDADYLWLGKLVWAKLQPSIDPAKPKLAQTEIDSLVTNMERNGGRIDLTLSELTELMNIRALGCGGGEGAFFGLDLKKLGL